VSYLVFLITGIFTRILILTLIFDKKGEFINDFLICQIVQFLYF
jgi:hypothetical protein